MIAIYVKYVTHPSRMEPGNVFIRYLTLHFELAMEAEFMRNILIYLIDTLASRRIRISVRILKYFAKFHDYNK